MADQEESARFSGMGVESEPVSVSCEAVASTSVSRRGFLGGLSMEASLSFLVGSRVPFRERETSAMIPLLASYYNDYRRMPGK
jgi:hypothetical protein